MTEADKSTEQKIIIDSDWKDEAASEKARLDEELSKQEASKGPLPEPTILELVNMVVMQASIGLGGYQTPTGETLPPDSSAAKHYIDLLELLKDKTAGNVTDEESKIIQTVLHELRLAYVQVVSGKVPTDKPPEQSIA